VGELRTMLDARQVSATELLGQAVARIEAHDPRINAVVVRDFERARAAAREADAALARGERRPLLGIPITIKESFNVGGLPTTWGLPTGRDWRPAEDAVAVARLKAAGAVVLGKTNLATAVADWQSFNAVYGITNNPWDPGRLFGRLGGGAGRGVRAAGTRLGHQRLDPHARPLLRRVRPQAHRQSGAPARPRPAPRGGAANGPHERARGRRTDGADRRRPRSGARSAGRPR
jgi:Asp-tRNA(Asn)/Glu-tRNA(Gln) amidotransferase A subunit family amidase